MVIYVTMFNMSVVDLTCWLEKAAKFNNIKKVMEQMSRGSLKSILDYTKDQVGS